MDNQQYQNPYSAPQNGAAGQGVPPAGGNPAQNAQPGANGAQNPYTAGQNPYGAPQTPPPYGQNPYGQNAYGQAPYTPPYTSPRPPYEQPPYGQRAPYGQPPYSGAPYGAATPPDPNLLKKKAESRALRTSSIAHGLAVLGFSVFAYVLSAILVTIPGFSTVFKNNALFNTAVNAAFSVVIIFLPFFFGYLFQKKRGLIKALPLGTPNDSKAAVLLVFIGLMCCVAGSYATGILTSVIESIFGVTFTMPENDAVINNVPMFFVSVLSTAVVPAFVEEFAIRGTVMQPLRRYGDKFAILMSALVFALMHGNMLQIPFAFVAGIAIGYAVTVSGSMWVGVAIHFLNNLMSVLMQTAVDNLSNTAENIAILVILAVVFTAGVVSLLLYLKFYARTPLQKGNTLLQNGEKTKAYLCTVPMILAGISLLIETVQYIEF